MLNTYSLRSFFIALAMMLQCVDAYAECAVDEPQCVAENQWQLGIAIGIGAKQNPLPGGDNIPLVLLPDIAWYGESAYFDNGELGYQLYDDNQFAIEGFVSINDERSFFSFWHPANVLFSQIKLSNSFAPDSIEGVGPELDDNQRANISIDDISKRKWALDGGIRFHYWLEHNQWQFTLKQDLSSVHQGAQASLSYQHHWQLSTWHLSLQPQLKWKSHRLLNYYYGLDSNDNVDAQYHYQVTSGWFPSLSILAAKPFAENWMYLLKADYTKLPNTMADSPIVDKSNVTSIFVGVAHRF